MNFKPKKLKPQQIKNIDQKYDQEIFGNIEKMENVWQEMHKFFKEHGEVVDYEYYPSYFRWYTDISWKRLHARKKGFVENIAVPRQLFIAMAINYRVWEKLMWYLGTNIKYQKEVEDSYARMKDNFLNSSMVIAKTRDSNFKMSDLIKKVKYFQQKDDSLERANFVNNLSDKIKKSENNWSQYVSLDHEDLVDEIMAMVGFFLSVDPEDVFYLADVVVHPERYPELSSQLLGFDVENSKFWKDKSDIAERVSEDIESGRQVYFTDYRIKLDDDIELSMQGIKGFIENKIIPATTEDNKATVVTRILNMLAEKQNNDKIRNLYYFDEEEGEFKWDEDLLEDDK